MRVQPEEFSFVVEELDEEMREVRGVVDAREELLGPRVERGRVAPAGGKIKRKDPQKFRQI